MEVLALAREGKIRSRIRRFPLSQAADAYALLREGKNRRPGGDHPPRALTWIWLRQPMQQPSLATYA